MASKSKRRGRVFRASCILAALIIAGSSFAWFTSKDEVTNRLTANADYGVKIVESFAPPANWLPGQTVNKDVYATNTGNMPAFVKESVSTAMTVTTEKNTPALTDKSVELTGDQRYAVEAGSFLAYKPNGSTKVLGETVVARPGDKTETEKLTFDPNNTVIPGTTNGQYTDFVPDVEGLYVFRRVVNVNSGATEDFKTDGDYYGTDVTKLANSDGTAITDANDIAAAKKASKVGYDAYYFVPADNSDPSNVVPAKYYKVSNLSVVPDNTPDKADDNDRTDGILLYASAGFVEKEKVVLDPMDLKCVTYTDTEAKTAGAPQGEAGKYLVASYDTGDSNKETEFKVAADLYDKAIHQLEYATALKDAAAKEAAAAKGAQGATPGTGTGYDGAKQTYDAALLALNGKTTALKNAKKEYEEALVARDNANEANEEAKKKYEDSMIKMYGKNDGGTTDTATTGYATTPTAGAYTQYSLYGKMKASETALAAYNSPTYDNDLYFINELKAFANDTTAYTVKTGYPANGDDINVTTMNDLKDKNYPVSFYEEFQAWLAGKENSEAHGYYAAKAQYLIDQKNYEDEYDACFGTAVNADKDHAATDSYSGKYNGTDGTGNANGTRKDLADKEGTLNTNSEAYLGTNGDGTGNGAIYEFNAAVKAYNDAYNDMMTKLGVKEEKDEQATNATTIFNAANAEKTRAETEYLKYVNNTTTAGTLLNGAFGAATDNTLDIFIKLSNKVVCDTDVPTSNDQWQHHPHDLVNYVADFYYTGILEGGETTSKLIDSVGLSTKADQTMYKDFDFDINVAMSSVQVAYDENKNITSVATPTELGAFGRLDGVNGDFTKATDLETKVIWKDATPTA